MQSNNQKSFKNVIKSICTKETFGLVLILFSVLTLVCLITRDLVFFDIGLHVSNFFLGAFGYFSYVLMVSCIILGYVMLTGKKVDIKNRTLIFALTIFALTLCLVHAVTARNLTSESYGEYLSACYNTASKGITGSTAGGLVLGLIMYWVKVLISDIGAYIIFPVGILATVFMFIKNNVPAVRDFGVRVKSQDYAMKVGKIKIEGYKEYPLTKEQFSFPSYNEEDQEVQNLYIRTDDFKTKSKRSDQVIAKLYQNPNGKLIHVETNNLYNQTKDLFEQSERPTVPEKPVAEEPKEKVQQVTPIISPEILNPTRISADTFISQRSVSTNVGRRTPDSYSRTPLNTNFEENKAPEVSTNRSFESYADIPDFSNQESLAETTLGDLTSNERITNVENDTTDDFDYQAKGIFDGINTKSRTTTTFPERTNVPNMNDTSSLIENTNERSGVSETIERPRSLFDSTTRLDAGIKLNLNEEKEESRADRNVSLFEEDVEESNITENVGREVAIQTRMFDTLAPKPQPKKDEVEVCDFGIPNDFTYNPPPLSLLRDYPKTEQHIDYDGVSRKIEAFFEGFGKTGVTVCGVIKGPVLTTYKLVLPIGIRGEEIIKCQADLQRHLCVATGLTITSMSEEGVIGVNVPNANRDTIALKEIIGSDTFVNANADEGLFYCVGKNLRGDPIVDNMKNGPHFLVAGTTGSGKTAFLDSIIISLLYKYSPSDLRLVLIDPKQVAFNKYEHIPHLIMDEVIYDSKRAMVMLDWLIKEMTARYALLRKYRVDKYSAYNKIAEREGKPKLPYIVIFIDEYAELQSVGKKEIEEKLKRISQLSRAAGMTIFLATQKPMVSVITSVLKSNLPGRIALKVASKHDSLNILEQIGAESLLGKGDMLYTVGEKVNFRYQSAFVDTPEACAVSDYIIANNEAYFNDSIAEEIESALKEDEEEDTINAKPVMINPYGNLGSSGLKDELFPFALHYAISQGEISASKLEAIFGIGFRRATNIMTALEVQKYIEPQQQGPSSKRRRVLVDRSVFETLYGDFDEFSNRGLDGNS